MSPLQDHLIRPIQKFLRLLASSSILLLAATVIALVWANSPWHDTYHDFWHAPVTLGIGPFVVQESLHFWINEGLMAIFFLVVGLEIKRELIVGDLSSPRQAALPIFAAIGGLMVPALIYFLFNPPGSEFSQGWGIPVVTDIAFAIGVLTALGNRVPLGLKVFLIALAIVDDLAAIVMIALFYSTGLQMSWILLALVVLLGLLILNRAGVDKTSPYLILGFILWVVTLQTGFHATVAGVLLALLIPAHGKIDPARFHEYGQMALERFYKAGIPPDKSIILTNQEHRASVHMLESLCEEVQPPLQEVEHALVPWSSFFVLPLFALANAGVHVEFAALGDALLHPVTFSIILGLFFGKQIGVTLFAWLAVKIGLANLPAGVHWPAIYGAGILSGIGFTMSIFISMLAFTDPMLIDYAKIGILAASLMSGVLGALVLRVTLPAR